MCLTLSLSCELQQTHTPFHSFCYRTLFRTSIFYVQLPFGLLLVQLVGHCIRWLRKMAICLGGCYTTQTAICSNYKATKSTNCCKHLQVIDLEMGMATIMIQNVSNHFPANCSKPISPFIPFVTGLFSGHQYFMYSCNSASSSSSSSGTASAVSGRWRSAWEAATPHKLQSVATTKLRSQQTVASICK